MAKVLDDGQLSVNEKEPENQSSFSGRFSGSFSASTIA
jgi:hypothetical protein